MKNDETGRLSEDQAPAGTEAPADRRRWIDPVLERLPLKDAMASLSGAGETAISS